MLSIVIPTFNEEKYLPFLLRSIQAQDYRDLEIIVADARSKDRTREIAESFGCKVVNGGLPAAGRNRGAVASRGDIILFLDADVILPDPYFLSSTIKEFRRRGLGSASCKIKPLTKRKMDKVIHEVFNYFMWVASPFLPHAPGFCIFSTREVYDAIGGFDEKIRLAEDHDYVARAAKHGKFRLLRSYRIPVSMRRFDRDGRLNVALKYFLCEVHMRTKGTVTTDIFNYTFGHPDATEKVLEPEYLHEKDISG